MWPFSSRLRVAQTDLFSGYVERHCHLLPGVDDGVDEPEESLRILRKMEELGVSELWLTPHIMEDIPNSPDDLRQRFEEFAALYRDSSETAGSIQLHLSAEHMLDTLFEKRLADGDVLPHADGQLLIETSYINPPFNMHELLNKVKQHGFFPLLAHPERYAYMDEDDYEQLKDMDVRFQLNLPSLTGAYGRTARKKALDLLKRGWYDCYGMDMHSERALHFFLIQKLPKSVLRQLELVGQG
ncbi:MAG: capsular biosynthesis protein [Bacteroidaceae bacterium]|nr:capsular biosynthesis protein [Bacteroidaceae bacterium]